MYAILTLIALSFIFCYRLFKTVTSTTQGKVGFKTGLALKYIKEYKGDDILVVREDFKKMIKVDYKKKLPVHIVNDFSIQTKNREVPVRFYNNSDDKDLSLIIFIHGGGWCIGDLDTHDQQCRRLVRSSGYSLLAVDYSLSPESKFPTALHEIVELIQNLIEGKIKIEANTNSIAIIGDSAGGNMAITSTLKLLESNHAESIKCIVPVYPVTNCENGKEGSFIQYANGYILTTHLMDLFTKNFINNNQDLKDPFLSPIFSDSLSKLPPCFILTAEYDPLRDEGERFAKKLKASGNKVKHKRYTQCVHSFFGQQEFGQKGLIAIEDVSVFLKKHLN